MTRTRAQLRAEQGAQRNTSSRSKAEKSSRIRKNTRKQEPTSSKQIRQTLLPPTPRTKPSEPSPNFPSLDSATSAHPAYESKIVPTTTNRKRRSDDRDDSKDTHDSKRPRTSPYHCEIVQDEPVKTVASKPSPVAHWVREGSWPPEYFEQQSGMERFLARKRSSSSLGRKRSGSGSATSVTPSDQRPREEKTAPYRDPRYKTLLATKGSFMDTYNLGIAETSKSTIKELLDTPQTYPRDSLFRDDIFETTCRKVADRNEARVMRDITPLVVPPVENLATFGVSGLDCLLESTNEGWNNSVPVTSTRPQPDYSVGFRREAFTDDQLEKLEPFVGDFIAGDQSLFMATYLMYFPFLTCEVKCGAAAIEIADRQNAHSGTIAARATVELFRLVKREKEIDRQVLAFSISHDHRLVRIYGYYPVIDAKGTKFYRHPIHEFSFAALDGKEKWTAYRFTKNVYDIWMPAHFKKICSAIDQLPSQLDFDVPPLPRTGLSQDLESHHVSQSDVESVPATDQQESQPGALDDQQTTPNTSFTGPGSTKKAKKTRGKKR